MAPWCAKLLVLAAALGARLGRTRAEASNSSSSSSGVTVRILSPLAFATYTADPLDPAASPPVFAEVDVAVTEGDAADALRAEPWAFELCVTWDAALADIGADDGTASHCKGILEPGELPNLQPLVTAGQLRSGFGTDVPFVFRAWVQRRGRAHGADDDDLATAEVPYWVGSAEAPPPQAAATVTTATTAPPRRDRASRLPCLVGVVLSGTVRTFASASVRRRFVAAVASLAEPPPPRYAHQRNIGGDGVGDGGGDGGGNGGGDGIGRHPAGPRVGCGVEVLAHVPRAAAAAGPSAAAGSSAFAPWAARSWIDDGRGGGGRLVPAFEASDAAAAAALQDLNASFTVLNAAAARRGLRQRRRQSSGASAATAGAVSLAKVAWFDEARHYAVPHACGALSAPALGGGGGGAPDDHPVDREPLPPQAAYAQLYKLAAAYKGLVLPRERALGRRFTLLVRCRWDLAWLRPPPPLAALRPDAVSVPYAFWPLSDQFALAPRHLAATYFSAVDAFYDCALARRHASWYLSGQVGTEIVLASHLLGRGVPLALVEVNAPIARTAAPAAWCAIRQTLQIPCLVLSATGFTDWEPRHCARPLGNLAPRGWVDDGDEGNQGEESEGGLAFPQPPPSPSSGGAGPSVLLGAACEADFSAVRAELLDGSLPPAEVASEAPAGGDRDTGASRAASPRAQAGRLGRLDPLDPRRWSASRPGAALDSDRQALEVRPAPPCTLVVCVEKKRGSHQTSRLFCL